MMKRQEAHNLWRDWISSVSFSTKPFILWFDSWRPHIMLSTHSLLYSIWILSHERGKGSGKNINIYRGSDFTSEDFNKLLSLLPRNEEWKERWREREKSELFVVNDSLFFLFHSFVRRDHRPQNREKRTVLNKTMKRQEVKEKWRRREKSCLKVRRMLPPHDVNKNQYIFLTLPVNVTY